MYDVINMPDLVNRYFSSTPWLVIFIASVIYLFFRLNMARKRALLTSIMAFFFVINVVVIKLFTRLDQNSTFYRHLWAIPSIAIIGIAVIDLIRILPRWFLKIPAIIALGILLWFVNDQEYIRCRVQTISVDAKLVPDDVIQLGDKLEELREERKKSTVFVVCPVAYVRNYGSMPTELGLYCGFLKTYDSSFLNNVDHNGETEMMEDNPDVSYIMNTCCANGIDYIIVSNREDSVSHFRTNGYEPILTTEGYCLYKCIGYVGYTQDLNAWGLVNAKTWYDAKGLAALNNEEYCTVKYEYDLSGRVKEERFYDTEGQLACNRWGYARAERKYDNSGNLVETRLFNDKGEPCIHLSSGWSILRYYWNNDNLMIRTGYFDIYDEPMVDYAAGAGMPHSYEEFTYDDRRNMISKKFLNVDGSPAKTDYGYDEIRYKYNDDHKVVEQAFYFEGMLTNRTDTGYARIIYEYNENKGIEKTYYYDQNGNSVNPQLK